MPPAHKAMMPLLTFLPPPPHEQQLELNTMSLAAKVVKGAVLKNPRPRKAVLTLVTSYRSSSCVPFFAHNALRMNYFGPALCPCRFAQLAIHAHTKSDSLSFPLPFFLSFSPFSSFLRYPLSWL